MLVGRWRDCRSLKFSTGVQYAVVQFPGWESWSPNVKVDRVGLCSPIATSLRTGQVSVNAHFRRPHTQSPVSVPCTFNANVWLERFLSKCDFARLASCQDQLSTPALYLCTVTEALTWVHLNTQTVSRYGANLQCQGVRRHQKLSGACRTARVEM